MPGLRDLYPFPNDNDIFLLDNTSTSNIQYYGFAAPGTLTSENGWRLIVLDLDSNGLPIGKRFAAGSPAYIHIYDNRTSLIYS